MAVRSAALQTNGRHGEAVFFPSLWLFELMFCSGQLWLGVDGVLELVLLVFWSSELFFELLLSLSHSVVDCFEKEEVFCFPIVFLNC